MFTSVNDFVDLFKKVDNRVAELVKEGSDKFKVDIEPRITYDLTGRTSAKASQDGVIRVNLQLLRENVDHFLHQTIGHEFAHLVQYHLYPWSKAHGPEWKSIMHRLGLPATRCHNYKTTVARVRKRKQPIHVQCGCVGGSYMGPTQYKKAKRGYVYHCRKCQHNLIIA